MNYANNHPSLAVQAHCCQNLYEPSDKYPDAKPSNTAFPMHDTFQNGIIKNGQPTTFYTAATNDDLDDIQNGNSHMSGFLSDELTVNSCKNADGVLDANEYASKTQTQPWRPIDARGGTEYTYRENIAAFDVNWDELNRPENADLKSRLCDSEGNLKCAYGKAEENTHWGKGGGNQYYVSKDDFNAGVNRGVFQYNENKTLREHDGTLIRKGVSEDEYDLMNINRQRNVADQLSSCPDKSATTDTEKAKSLNEITPDKAHQINSAEAPEGSYLASPDPAYHYGQASGASRNNHSHVNGASDKVAEGGGTNAPNAIRGNTDNPPEPKKPSRERGQAPLQETNNTPTKEPIERGHLPEEATAQIDAAKTAAAEAQKVAEEAAQKAAEKQTSAVTSTAGMGM